MISWVASVLVALLICCCRQELSRTEVGKSESMREARRKSNCPPSAWGKPRSPSPQSRKLLASCCSSVAGGYLANAYSAPVSAPEGIPAPIAQCTFCSSDIAACVAGHMARSASGARGLSFLVQVRRRRSSGAVGPWFPELALVKAIIKTVLFLLPLWLFSFACS